MTRAQIMLKHAHDRISKREVTKEYRTVVLGAGSMIQSAGLAQALAYFSSKNDEAPYRQLLEDLESSPAIGSGSLLTKAASVESAEYMRLTRMVIEQVLYLKRIAIAFYTEKKSNA